MNPQGPANIVSSPVSNSNVYVLGQNSVPSEVKHKSGCFKKLLLGLLILVVLLIALVISVIFLVPKILSLTAKDIPPIDDKDILPTFIKLPDKDNAFYDLDGLQDISSEQEQEAVLDYISLKKWEDNEIAQILDKNQAAFAKWDNAVKKASFQDPFYQDPITPAAFQPGFPHRYSTYQAMARLNTLRGLNQIKEGSDSAGLNTLFETLDIGQKIQRSDSGLIGNLLGTSIKAIGFKGLQAAIGKLTIPHSMAILLSRRLDSYPFDTEALKEALKQEYFVQAYTIDSFVSGQLDKIYPPDSNDSATLALRSKIKGGMKNSYLLQPNKTKSLYVNSFRSQISNVDSSCVNLNATDSQTQKKPFTSTDVATLPFKENAIGEILYNVGASFFNSVVYSKCNQEIELNTTKLLLALRQYELEKGSLPVTLDQLMLNDIAVLPLDPFDNQPLKYSLSKKIIYSIGQNKKDDGGQGKIGDLSSPDYIVLINF